MKATVRNSHARMQRVLDYSKTGSGSLTAGQNRGKSRLSLPGAAIQLVGASSVLGVSYELFAGWA